MIRKKTALFFILLANIVLLAHAVVPHHHHNSLLCIESDHCPSGGCTHADSSSACDREHDGDTRTECCVLKQAVVIPANSAKQEFNGQAYDDNHSPFVHFQAILPDHACTPLAYLIIQQALIPLRTSSYCLFVSTSSGLRAPPVV